jgi:hypothetical protein
VAGADAVGRLPFDPFPLRVQRAGDRPRGGSAPEISAPKPKISKRLVITTAPSTAESPATRCATSKTASSSAAIPSSLLPSYSSQPTARG